MDTMYMENLNTNLKSINKQLFSFKDQLADLERRNNLLEDNIGVRVQTEISNALTQYNAQVVQNVTALRQENNTLRKLVLDTDQQIKDLVATQDKEHTQRNTQLYNTIQAVDKKYANVHFDIIHNDNNIAITYVNSNGIAEYGSIEKITVDEDSFCKVKGKISLKNKLDQFNFKTENNKISVIGLTTDSGVHVSANTIQNALITTDQNLSKITARLNTLSAKLDKVGGYMASNNFKMARPTDTQLTNYIISCMSSGLTKIKASAIPNGTKIKNLFDNHIWVFNTYTLDGLTQYKWEDLGSDSVCIATNDGIRGLVTGSTDMYKGFVDINGQISINGLEELANNVQNILTDIIARLDSLEKKVK